ncbi:2-succinyl-5-enolpyruvyl-6-hydroxy-3-cyclohexene-1-carboxylic-acid synthase [Pedococcus bigeumensis]|uniref:2-succinyl-5-enolpyruvyl-6-hydroxy-3-cyclohexene-1-carboxylate synthase n=1 Tax=Pedococcus bigeumensis TaxID=433644 RepID=A0A502CRN6_9MICO|nr:2-succinyl-5-enolpyruvyl-6-hydroxy-3-cyclohexene-1-carboxylic-acid synthase [Pedococcus bigeumensis]TPG14779.1 2-succinyl-5-enolpyruvyl-6-hydroxy-3-cyclohexene-1-carboxylic-acid synthase [Pedococcus bigeumensis]
MNPSTALATVLVDELIRQGVRHAVLCPGSRSAPLAYALQDADREGRLTLHVRVDERSAGFLALGLAKLTRVPAVLVTTSGTAVANLHPAVLEAHHATVPLLVLSADRPPELRGTGANQTTVQPGMFGGAVRWSHEIGTPERRAGQQAHWRSTISRAVAAARGLGGDPGPVHLNVPFREPLVPTPDEGDWPEPLEGRGDAAPWTSVTSAEPAGADPLLPVARTLVVIGDLPDPEQRDRALDWAAAHGWPVVSEPFGSHPRVVVPHGPLLLTAAAWLDDHAPDRVVTVGRVTLSRAVAALLRRQGLRVETVPATSPWTDTSAVVAAVHPLGVLATRPTAAPDLDWATSWQQAGQAVAKALADQPPHWPSAHAVARAVLGALPAGSTLFLGSSNAVRDVDLALNSSGDDLTIVASRGLAGIDGCVSTAVGVALGGAQPAYALVGDLTFLHDANALLVGPDEPVPDLTVVVTNDDGGGIFTLLEPGEPRRAADFERVFGTPTGTNLNALCAAHGVAHTLAASADDLARAVAARRRGLHVVEVRTARGGHREANERLRELAAAALAGEGA